MRKGFYAVMAVFAGACFISAACDDEDTTTPAGTTSGTSTGCADPVDAECVQVCTDFLACVFDQPGQCPGLQDTNDNDFKCGASGTPGCFDNCDANPALKAVIDPTDCATTVGTILTLNPNFAASCAEGGGGGTGGGTAGSGGTGGTGGGTAGGGG